MQFSWPFENCLKFQQALQSHTHWVSDIHYEQNDIRHLQYSPQLPPCLREKDSQSVVNKLTESNQFWIAVIWKSTIHAVWPSVMNLNSHSFRLSNVFVILWPTLGKIMYGLLLSICFCTLIHNYLETVKTTNSLWSNICRVIAQLRACNI